ncbi:unnamed protein product, partial [Mesorhabditis belari]|uniref:Uncharacterized protein n=1 Tax=Mesorhabditis belari TaxID=2138241 RepID=A0AAF3J5T3_9BILA
MGSSLRTIMWRSVNPSDYSASCLSIVFIANPEKNQAILAILTRNRVKLLGFLQNFCNERDKDDQFNDEKDYVMRQINTLPSHDQTRSMSPGRDLAADVTQRRYGRARVVEAVSNELVRVIFIDEGRLQWVNPICLAVMPDNFYYHPWQAMYMCLGGVSPIDSCMTEPRPRWTEKHDAAFREIIREFELFKVVVIKSTKERLFADVKEK